MGWNTEMPRGYDAWKTTPPEDDWDEDICPDCGYPYEECMCGEEVSWEE